MKINLNFSKFFGYIDKIYTKIFSSSRNILIVLFSVSLLTRLPYYVLVESNTPTGDEAHYLSIAENIAAGNGFTKGFKEYFFESDGTTQQVSFGNNGYAMSPLYPLLLSVFILIGFSYHQLLLVQFLLLLSFVYLYHNFISEKFNKYVSFYSCLLLILHPTFFDLTVNYMRDLLSLNIFLIILILFSHENRYSSAKHAIVLALFMALFFYSRGEINLILLPVIIFYIYQRYKTTNIIIFLVAFLSFILPWILLRLEHTGYLFPRFYQSRYYPHGEEILADKSSSLLNRLLFTVRSLYFAYSTEGFTTFGFFYIIFPLAVIGIFMYYDKLRINYFFELVSALIFLVTYSFLIPFTFGESLQIRYLLPLLIVIIPIGAKMLFDIFEIIPYRFNHVRNISFLTVFIISFSICISHIGFVTYTYDSTENQSLEQYEWLNDNTEEGIVVSSWGPGKGHFATGLEFVRLAFNLNNTHLINFIDTFNISYILIEDKFKSYYSEDYPWVKKAYLGNDEIILMDSFKLVLVDSNDSNLIDQGYGLYQVVR